MAARQRPKWKISVFEKAAALDFPWEQVKQEPTNEPQSGSSFNRFGSEMLKKIAAVMRQKPNSIKNGTQKKAASKFTSVRAKAKAKAKIKAKQSKKTQKMKTKFIAKRKSVKPKKAGNGSLAKIKTQGCASEEKGKQEPGSCVAVKREQHAADHKIKNPREHFKHQVGFIEQIISGEWDICFGALGTGMVGVCQRGIPAFDTLEEAEQGAPAQHDLADAQDSVVDDGRGSSSSSSIPARGRRLSRDAVIILYKNAPARDVGSRNGKSFGSYSGGLNVDTRTLAWSSQHQDKYSKRLNAIVDHVGRSGRVLVAVRPPSTKDSEYRMLGQVVRIDGVHSTQWLVQEGETVIQERGTTTVHKAIGPSCLSASLRAGVGLTSVEYKPSQMRLCSSCGIIPPCGVLHFDYLEPIAVSAYQLPKGATLELSESSQAGTMRPRKRIRVKRDPDAETPGGTARQASEAVPIKRELEAVAIKREPLES